MEKLDELLLQYDEQKHVYDDLSDKLRPLIEQMLENFEFHSIESRVKTRKSLSDKIQNKEKYAKLSDVTDVCGVRIITIFNDDVDRVASVIEKEFKIDDLNSIDKRKSLEPERFGYLSLHYVASFTTQRTDLLEYKRFLGLKFEIQIRSVLQHAWAEIEHDIGYKISGKLPNLIRRRFSRLAGLLEIADDEFTALRIETVRFEQDAIKRIKDGTWKALQIDIFTLKAFVENSEHRIAIEDKCGKELALPILKRREFQILIDRLNFLGITTLGDLDKKLSAIDDNLTKYARRSGTKEIHRGFSVNALCIFLMHHGKSSKDRYTAYKVFGFGDEKNYPALEKIFDKWFSD